MRDLIGVDGGLEAADDRRVTGSASKLDYRYEFVADDYDAILSCFAAHGFAVVRGGASADIVDDLRAAVWAVLGSEDPPAYGDNRTTPNFVEHCDRALRLLDAEHYVALNERLFGTTELTIHRSFAVLKQAGSAPVAWHRDFHHLTKPQPSEPDEFLDAGDFGFRALWYLDGSYPDQGGLWLIPDSHVEGWQPPPGFAFTEGRKSFHPVGEPAVDYEGFDAPGMLPLHVDPGDLVLYSLKTYHGAVAQPRGTRRACAIILRPSDPPIEVPWAQTAASEQFLARLDPRYARFVSNYVGIDYTWERWADRTSDRGSRLRDTRSSGVPCGSSVPAVRREVSEWSS